MESKIPSKIEESDWDFSDVSLLLRRKKVSVLPAMKISKVILPLSHGAAYSCKLNSNENHFAS